MKKIIYSFGFFAMAISFSGCGDPENKACSEFTMDLPAGWVKTEITDPDYVFAAEDPNGDGDIKVMKGEADQMTFDEFRGDIKSGLLTGQGELISENEMIKIDGIKTEKIVFNIPVDAEGQHFNVKGIGWLLYNGPDSFFITANCLSENFEKYRPAMEKAVDGFKCKNQ